MFSGRWTAVAAACAALLVGVAGFHAVQPAVTGEEPNLYAAPGYAMTRIAEQFTAPVGLAVGREGELYVAEAGMGKSAPPRVVKWAWGDRRSVIAADFPAPLTGLTWYQSKLMVAYTGGVDLLDPVTGLHHPVLTNLPAAGDHPDLSITVGPDDKLYVGIGSVTNAAVVGADNLARGWVSEHPQARDIPCKDVALRGTNFSIPNTLTPDPQDLATTGAFSAFGTTTARLQTVPGAVPCTAAVLRANPDGSHLEMVAWGLRYPAGLAFGPDGELYATVQGLDDRGSRPVLNDRDDLYRLERGRWYGWPDFAGGKPVTAEEFQKPSMPVHPLLASPPEQPPLPVLQFEPGAGVRALLFPSESFGLRGEALAALSGTKGGRLLRVNPRTGTAAAFAMVRDRPTTPWALASGLDGAVYLLDRGELRQTTAGPVPVPGTGSVLRITRSQGSAVADPKQVQWQWTLVGMVLSLTGLRLVSVPQTK